MARETDLMNLMNRIESLESQVRFQQLLETSTAVTEFSPTDITSILLWYDFQDYYRLFTDAGTTRVFANSAAIYQVNDKSGNDDHATQSTSGSRPAYTQILNDLSASLYDGTADFLIGPTNVDLSGGCSIFAVMRPTEARIHQLYSIYNDDGSGIQNRLQCYVASDGSVGFRLHQNATGSGVYIGRKSAVSEVSANLTYLIEGHYDGGTTESGIDIILNGSAVDNADDSAGSFTGVPSTTNVPFRVGTQFSGVTPVISAPWKGYIMDVVVFGAEITEAEKTSMRTYLNGKWSIY